MARRENMRQANWLLPIELIERLKLYQHDHRIDNQREAAERLLNDALAHAGYPPTPPPAPHNQ